MEKLDDRFSEEAKMLARLAPKASMEAVRAAWARGLSVTVLEYSKMARSSASRPTARGRLSRSSSRYDEAFQNDRRPQRIREDELNRRFCVQGLLIMV